MAADAFVQALPQPITVRVLKAQIQLTHYRFTFGIRDSEIITLPAIYTRLIAGVLDDDGVTFIPHPPSLQTAIITGDDLTTLLAAGGAAKPQGVFRNTDVLNMHRTIVGRT